MPITKYLWDGDNILAETDGSDTVTTVYTNEPQQYGNLVSQRSGTTTSYFHFDVLGSTRQLTNAAGVVSDTFTYNAWGEEVARTGTTATPFRWIGELGYYWDSERQLYYIRRRSYSGPLAQWMAVDPLFYWIGAVQDRYGYSAYRVATFVDPLLNTQKRFLAPFILPGRHNHPKHDFRDNKGCCKITAMKLVCRTMPSIKHHPASTHCYFVFKDEGKDWDDTISGQNPGDEGPNTFFSDTFWDLNYANNDVAWLAANGGPALQHEHPFALPLGMNYCSAYDCLYDAAAAIDAVHPYNQFTDNSNTFLTRVINKCGLMANFPPSAIASDDVGAGTDCRKMCLAGAGVNIGTATAAQIAECTSRCNAFNSASSKPF